MDAKISVNYDKNGNASYVDVRFSNLNFPADKVPALVAEIQKWADELLPEIGKLAE